MYLYGMEDKKRVLSIQTTESVITKLKEIAKEGKRSQGKTIEVLIEEEHKKLKK